MAGDTVLLELQYDRIGITVKQEILDLLCMARTLSLFPDTLFASAEVVGVAGRECEVVRLFVHIGEHQYVIGLIVLCDSGDEGVFVPVYCHDNFSEIIRR
jgi:hypothetical protein